MGNHASSRSKKNRCVANYVPGSKIPRRYLTAPTLAQALKLDPDEEIKFDNDRSYIFIRDKWINQHEIVKAFPQANKRFRVHRWKGANFICTAEKPGSARLIQGPYYNPLYTKFSNRRSLKFTLNLKFDSSKEGLRLFKSIACGMTPYVLGLRRLEIDFQDNNVDGNLASLRPQLFQHSQSLEHLTLNFECQVTCAILDVIRNKITLCLKRLQYILIVFKGDEHTFSATENDILRCMLSLDQHLPALLQIQVKLKTYEIIAYTWKGLDVPQNWHLNIIQFFTTRKERITHNPDQGSLSPESRINECLSELTDQYLASKKQAYTPQFSPAITKESCIFKLKNSNLPWGNFKFIIRRIGFEADFIDNAVVANLKGYLKKNPKTNLEIHSLKSLTKL